MTGAKMYRLAIRAIAPFFLLLGLCAAVAAQDWPAKTVRIVVPFGPGSTPDIVARLVADGLQQRYPGSAFLVENKPGASGNLGTDMVAKAASDGSTLGVSIGEARSPSTLCCFHDCRTIHARTLLLLLSSSHSQECLR